mmetsp:Transcript_1981/g.3050  ORF Transcript_1981/g.3050 Transcript_1981/m.3050 type:complete len:396 (-) Transcript_1981:140-1327(-)
MLRFPLHRIMDTDYIRAKEAPLRWLPSSREYTATSASSATPDEPGGQECDRSSPSSNTSSSSEFEAAPEVQKQICIEEIHLADHQRDSTAWDDGFDGYLQLAQNTATSSSIASVTDAQEDDMAEYREWISTLGGFTPPSTATTETSLSTIQGTWDTESSESLVLDILPTPQSGDARASTEARSVANQGIWRSISLPPPIDSGGGSAQEQYHLLRGGIQGLPMAPATYVVAERLPEQREEGNEQETLSVPGSLPSLIPGEPDLASNMTQSEQESELHDRGSISDETISILLQAEEMSADNENNSEADTPLYYGQLSSNAVAAGQWEGDTMASTVSSLSRVEVYCVEGLSVLQLTEHTREIPFREMDDPPDTVEIDVALLDGGREFEYGSEGDVNNP